MGSLPFTLLAFIVALAILISIHEFGHFWVARKLGVKVLRFSVGFGKPLWTKKGKVDDTEYVVAAIPLGGYVKMLDEREAPVAEEELHRAFNRQSLKVRSAIVIAGPLFNFLFAILTYWLIFIIGDTGLKPIVGEVIPDSPAAEAGLMPGDQIAEVGTRKTATWENTVYAFLAGAIETESIAIAIRDKDGFNRNTQMNLTSVDPENTEIKLLDQLGIKPFSPELPPIIGQVLAGEPAAQAGLKQGDRILQTNEQTISNWSDWVEMIRNNPDKALTVEFERNGQVVNTTLIPAAVESGDKAIGRIGAAAQVPEGFFDEFQARERYAPLDALQLSVEKTWDFSVLTLKVLGKILIGEASVNNLSGPITIAQTAGKSASIGYMYFLKFLAIVSISLGVLNLLPIPVLDGGHLLFFILEAIKGSALSETFIEQGQRIGFALLIALMGVAFYVDINRFFN